MPQIEYIDRIPKNANSPLVALDYYQDEDTPLPLDGYTGIFLAYTKFTLQANVAVGVSALSVASLDASGTISGLIKAGDTVVVGNRTNVQYTVQAVSDTALTITLTVPLAEAYYEDETVKVIWKKTVTDATNIVVGKDGIIKNRVQIQLADTDTNRVYDRHECVFKLTDSTGSVEIQLPDSRYVNYLDIFDDVDGLSL